MSIDTSVCHNSFLPCLENEGLDLMKKVLIITYNFPPLNNIASRRFSELAPFFYQLGWEPYILTTQSDGDLISAIPEEHVFRVTKHPQRSVAIQDNKRSNSFIAKLRQRWGLSFRSIDSTYKSWYRPVISSDVIEKLEALELDFIIASYSPSASLFLGSKISKKLNVPWLADFRDLGALHQDVFVKSNFIVSYLDRLHEKMNIRSASFLTTVSKALAYELASAYKKKTEVIYNGWASESFLPLSPELKADTYEKPYIYYAGRFYQHRMQAIYLLIDAIKDKDLVVVIRSLGPVELERQILDYADSKGVPGQIKILSSAKASVIDKEQSKAKINLIVEDLDKTYDSKKGVLTGKLMQLLTYNPPILTIARNDSEIGDVLIEAGKGVLASSVEEVERFLKQVLDEGSAFVTSAEKIAVYSKESQAIKLVSLMDHSLSHTR